MTLCIIDGCEQPSHREADECPRHLREFERVLAAYGYAASPCRNGHSWCAHFEDGPCHADPGYDCPKPYCRGSEVGP